MRLLGQLQTSLFCFTKRFRAYENANQTKTNHQNKIKRTKNNKGNNFSRRENWLVLVWFAFIVLTTSFTILLTCTPINPPVENLSVRNYFYLGSSLRISTFYENLFKSFLSARTSSFCESLFFLWESFGISILCVNLSL